MARKAEIGRNYYIPRQVIPRSKITVTHISGSGKRRKVYFVYDGQVGSRVSWVLSDSFSDMVSQGKRKRRIASGDVKGQMKLF